MTIQELKDKRAAQEREAAIQMAERAEGERVGNQRLISTWLDELGLIYTPSNEDSSVEVEGYHLSMYEHPCYASWSYTDTYLTVQKGRSVPVLRKLSGDWESELLDLLAEADANDRLDNRPYVDKLLADIRMGKWDDDYSDEEQFAPWRDELHAAFEARVAAHTPEAVPTLTELLARIDALEAANAAQAKTIEGLERWLVTVAQCDNETNDRVIAMEARCTALEAASQPAPDGLPANDPVKEFASMDEFIASLGEQQGPIIDMHADNSGLAVRVVIYPADEVQP